VVTDFRRQDLEWARAVADVLLERFEDGERGGLWFTSHDHEQLIQRPKTAHDGATPSGNGVAAYALQRLGHLIGETRYVETAERALKAFYPGAERNPSGHTSLSTALEEALSPPRIAVLRGPADEIAGWRAKLAAAYRPDTMIVAIARDERGLPGVLDKPAPGTGSAAWLCEGLACRAPVFSLCGIENLLDSRAAP
jgi:hypothetical protein